MDVWKREGLLVAGAPVLEELMTYHITLPVPLSWNQYVRYDKRTGRVLTSKAGRFYKGAVYFAVKEMNQAAFPLHGKLAISCVVYFGNRRKRDLDNCLKVTLDGFRRALYDDDSQIDELSIKRAFDKENPRMEVFVTEL